MIPAENGNDRVGDVSMHHRVGDVSIHRSDSGSVHSIDDNDEESAYTTDEDPALLQTTNRLKVTVIVFLILLCICVSFAVWHISSHTVQQNFESTFKYDASQLREAFNVKMGNKLWAGEGLSVTYESFVSATEGTWPFVTLPYYDLRNEATLALAEAKSFSFSPLVSNETRQTWELYASQNQKLLGIDASTRSRPINQGIYKFDDRGHQQNETSSSMYMPIWQIAPISNQSSQEVMLNQFSRPGLSMALTAMLEEKVPTYSDIVFSEWDQSRSSPTIVTFFPVFKDQNSSDVVGTIALDSNPTCFFERVLSSNGPLIIVLENTCGSAVTFEVHGPNTTYLGEGDLHDALATTADKVTFGIDKSSLQAGLERAIHGVCDYTMSVYPTNTYEQAFQTFRPILFPIVCVLLFGINIFLFLVYDKFVQTRQQQVVENAQDSKAIVRELFPSVIRDRLMQSNHTKGRPSRDLEANSHGFFTRGRRRGAFPPMRSQNINDHSQDAPIAELFPNTTIMFADIAGFTAWSSEREPAQVFQLLETTYRAFDLVAKGLGVFKVETIGDCCKWTTADSSQTISCTTNNLVTEMIVHQTLPLLGCLRQTRTMQLLWLDLRTNAFSKCIISLKNWKLPLVLEPLTSV